MFGEIIKKRFSKVLKLDEGKIVNEILTNPSLQAQIIDLNQSQLYDKGLQSDGSPTGDYSPTTKAFKEAYGDARGIPGRTDHITGLDTGKTYDSMTVVAQSNGIVIEADNNGFFDREPQALGLTREDKQELLPEIREEIIEKIEGSIT